MPIINLEVTEEVIDRLRSVAVASKKESCGVFTGSVTKNGIYRINNISPILVADASSENECIRNADKANEFIKEEFGRSNGTRVYFGEWHTHPEAYPTPSGTDKKAISIIFKEDRIPLGLVFFAIAGWNDIYWGYFDGKLFYRITSPIII